MFLGCSWGRLQRFYSKTYGTDCSLPTQLGIALPYNVRNGSSQEVMRTKRLYYKDVIKKHWQCIVVYTEDVSKWLKEDVHVQCSLCIKLLLTSDSDFKDYRGPSFRRFESYHPPLYLKIFKKV